MLTLVLYQEAPRIATKDKLGQALFMVHLPSLIQDLGVILITAAAVTLLCKSLKQPVVLGYLIAGLLVGPHFPILPTVHEVGSIQVWAEIGVIFLLFGLGLEFSFKKLAQVGKSASITAATEIVFMLALGYLTGLMFGWSKMDSLFLGGILSISSTTIIVRAFEELQLKGRGFVSLVLGVLIVEDLAAILILVILSSVAVTQSLAGGELLLSGARLVFYLVLWFVLGIYILPIVLNRIRHHLSDETMLVISIGLCLLMVIVATQAGFSPALGAFTMGSLLAETREGHRIERLINPVRDLFAAVFFVSVGMLLDPQVLRQHWGVILVITTLTIVGKVISVAIGAILSGKNLKSSMKTGLSLAQIGEFSFIIATLGVTLKVTSSFLYPIAVAVSAVTTFTTPYLIRHSDSIVLWLEKSLPADFRARLARYESAMGQGERDNVFTLIWREYGIKMLLNLVIVLAITLTMSTLILPRLENRFMESSLLNAIVCLITILVSAPFMWALVAAPRKRSQAYSADTLETLRRLQFGISICRFLLGLFLLLFIVGQFASMSAAVALVLLVFTLFLIYFSRFAEPMYQLIEKQFLSNLSEKEKDALGHRPRYPDLAPWNATLAEFVVSPTSPFVAQKLLDLKIKEDFGVMVAMIERGERQILAPGRDDILLPFDRLFLIGTDDQLDLIRNELEKPYPTLNPMDKHESSFGLESFLVAEDDPLVEKTIRDCGLREKLKGLIVGIERNGERILNPDSNLNLKPFDRLWVVGDLRLIKNFKSSLS